MALLKTQLLAVANDCHTSYHKDLCAPVDLFKVSDYHDGFIYLVPNHERYIHHFLGETMTFIADFLNSHRVCWMVVWRSDSVAIRLLDD